MGTRTLSEILDGIEPPVDVDVSDVPVQLVQSTTLKRSEGPSAFIDQYCGANIGGNRLNSQNRIRETLRGWSDEIDD